MEKTINIFTGCGDAEVMIQWCSQPQTPCRTVLPTPSLRDRIKNIPELSRVGNLNSWKDICDHLRIEVGSDSARRALDRWAKVNKPNWPEIPEP